MPTDDGNNTRTMDEASARAKALIAGQDKDAPEQQAARDVGKRPELAAPYGDPMLQFFEYAHLKSPLAECSKLFHVLAHSIVQSFPRNPERTVALRKLLEAKDCAVRSLLYKN